MKNRKEVDKRYRESHKEKIKTYQKSYRESHKEVFKLYRETHYKTYYDKQAMKKYFLKKKYNITIEEYNKLFDKQNGCCAICGKHQSEFKRVFAVEHCHTTGKVRGLCCSKCNSMLGFANDNITIFQNAIKYLS